MQVTGVNQAKLSQWLVASFEIGVPICYLSDQGPSEYVFLEAQGLIS